MKYVNRDNLRYLTGFGREWAQFLEYVFTNWEVDGDKPAPTGNLIVRKDPTGTEFSATFLPYGDHLSEHEYIGDYKASRPLALSLFVEQDGLCEITVLPFHLVMNGFPDCSGYYQVYQHHFLQDATGEKIQGGSYIGVTKRGWRTRWAEHLRAAKGGSQYRFHRAIRQWNGNAKTVMHMIIAWGLSEQQAMSLEETLVEKESLYPRGLNMVPGGNAGLAYLRKIGAIGAHERVAPDERQSVINRFFDRASRKGVPNPLAAANWLNPDYAEKVICAGPDRLKSQQIRDARFLASLGRNAADIASQVGARNIAQIERMLSGSTYSRVA